MKKTAFPRVGEEMYEGRLPNGLPVFVFPKPGYAKAFAFFATNYGGMHTRFRLDGVWQETPAGVAHFLEHKTFDTPEGNALQKLTANGANPNAFTSSTITGYYFECTSRFEENLRTLLNFVSVPYYTQKSVDKEQGIIAQEIRMMEDDPGWRVFMGAMNGLYASHPVRKSVCGTVESIAQITAETLNTCHRAFYTPANMVLCVAADIDPEQVMAIAEEVLPETAPAPAEKEKMPEESQTAACHEVERVMDVSAPLFQMGFKGDDPGSGRNAQRTWLTGTLALEALLGSSSPLYERLYREGLINHGFSWGCEIYPGCSCLLADGESGNPAAVRDAVLAEAQRIAEEGIDPALWERLCRGVYGIQVRALNSLEHLCVEQAQAYFKGYRFLDFAEVFSGISRADAENMIRTWVTPERSALSTVRPAGGKKP